jgi:transcriptional regulator
MYVPKIYAETEKEAIVAFMRQYSFATIVTVNNGFQSANHLPFVITEHGDELMLTSHFAKSNTQWQAVTNGQVLVIFNEPHAYISPGLYNSKLSVPTWNYMAVHAYGMARIIVDENEVTAALEEMIQAFEPNYKKQWDEIPGTWKSHQTSGIVVFKIKVTSLQAKKKLSQNKREDERIRIAASLSGSWRETDKAIADLMTKALNW